MRRYTIGLLALLVLSCTRGNDEIIPQTVYAEEDTTPVARLRVMSSNVRTSASDSGIFLWTARRDAYRAMLSETAPDVIGLQEVSSDEKVADLTAVEGYGHYYIDAYDGPETEVTAAGGRIDGGVMLLWKEASVQCLETGRFWLGEQPDGPHYTPFGGTDAHCRACVWARMKDRSSGREFYFFNTHYPHTPDVYDADGNKIYNVECRRLCSEQVLGVIRATVPTGMPVFLTGDFNCSVEDGVSRRGYESLACLTDYFRNAWLEAAVTDGGISFNGFTSDARKRSATIDYIFYRGAVAQEYRTVNGTHYGVEFISDHYPILTDFTIQ